MIKLYLIIGTVLLGTFGFLGYSLYEAGGSIAALRQENKGLREASNRAVERANWDRQALLARQAELSTSRTKLAHAQQALQNALRANKSWSDTDVPPDIQKALGGAGSGPQSGPGHLPDGSASLPEPAGGVQ